MTFFHLDFINSKLLLGALLLFVSIMGSKLATRVGVPMLIFFIVVGIVTKQVLTFYKGAEADNYFSKEEAKLLGVVTLTFILFSGGLETEKKHVYAVWRSGLMLSTLGVVVTALFAGLFLYQSQGLLGLSKNPKVFPISLLIGAIVASTDAAAVFSILRAHKIHLKRNIAPLLELESGSNDVMVYFLMTFLLKVIHNDAARIVDAIPIFFLEMVIGAVGGICAGRGMAWALNKINLQHQGLYSPFTIAMLFLTFSAVNVCHGSGYLAVYIAGIILGNRDFMRQKSIIEFYEGIGWLLQISMFIALGLLVKLDILLDMAPLGIGLSLVLMLGARPLSVFLSLLRSTFTVKHKLFISWVGLRGAVPIVFATYLYGTDGLADEGLADKIFHLIFFVVLVSVLVQGSTLYPIAKKWELEAVRKRSAVKKEKRAEETEDFKKMFMQLEIPAESPIQGKKIVELGLPKEAFIVLIYRNKRYFHAHGDSVMQPYDKLFVTVDSKKVLNEMKACLGIT